MEIQKLVPKEPRGLVVVITGHGKGKTTTEQVQASSNKQQGKDNIFIIP